jgi:hypothetical protein
MGADAFAPTINRHHPRKRVTQYSSAPVANTDALQYWVARSSRAMTLLAWSGVAQQPALRSTNFMHPLGRTS